MDYRPLEPGALARLWLDSWGEFVVSKGHVIRSGDVESLALFEGDELVAVASFQVDGDSAEITSLDALRRGHGYGRQLLAEVERRLAARGVTRCWLVTTNDNVHAISVYLREGWRLVGLRLDALEEVRALKPAVPLTGENGIPLRDEWEFEKHLA
jgi:GNAT superfamily N-acetyltransferase